MFASNADLEITEGYAIGHNWKGFASPRQWNGAVRYTVLAGDPTASPVVEPTGVPTASPVVEPAVSSSPSAAPSLKVCHYVSLIFIRCVCICIDELVTLTYSSSLLSFISALVIPVTTNEWL